MQRMFTRILQCQMAPVHGLSAEGMDLLRRLLDPNPATRLSVQQALHHPWVTIDMPPGLQVWGPLVCMLSRCGAWQIQFVIDSEGWVVVESSEVVVLQPAEQHHICCHIVCKACCPM